MSVASNREVIVVGRILLLTLACLWLPLSQGSADADSGPLSVMVSVLPHKYFVERIGGEAVAVSAMVLPGANPAVYEPKPKQMTKLARAVLYFAAGVPFETVWLPRFQRINSKMRVVDVGAGITRRRMDAHHHEMDQDAEGKSSPREGVVLDPHIWLSPPLVLIQARNIWKALCEADPDHAADYDANYRRFASEVVELDTGIRNTLGAVGPNRSFLVFHPAWGYFAQAYSLRQWAVELEGKEPKAADLQQLIRQSTEKRVRVVFVQPQFSTRSAKTIADAIGARLVPLDPLAENWSENLMHAAKQIAAALTPDP